MRDRRALRAPLLVCLHRLTAIVHVVYQVPPSYRYAAPKVCLQRSLASKARSTELQTTSLLNECCVSDVASVAMDGVAPDLVQEAPWREERH